MTVTQAKVLCEPNQMELAVFTSPGLQVFRIQQEFFILRKFFLAWSFQVKIKIFGLPKHDAHLPCIRS